MIPTNKYRDLRISFQWMDVTKKQSSHRERGSKINWRLTTAPSLSFTLFFTPSIRPPIDWRCTSESAWKGFFPPPLSFRPLTTMIQFSLWSRIEERGRSVGLTCFFLSAAPCLTEMKSCLCAWLRTSKDRQIWRNSSVVGCVTEVGTATTSWLWKKSESCF